RSDMLVRSMSSVSTSTVPAALASARIDARDMTWKEYADGDCCVVSSETEIPSQTIGGSPPLPSRYVTRPSKKRTVWSRRTSDKFLGVCSPGFFLTRFLNASGRKLSVGWFIDRLEMTIGLPWPRGNSARLTFARAIETR